MSFSLDTSLEEPWSEDPYGVDRDTSCSEHPLGRKLETDGDRACLGNPMEASDKEVNTEILGIQKKAGHCQTAMDTTGDRTETEGDVRMDMEGDTSEPEDLGTTACSGRRTGPCHVQVDTLVSNNSSYEPELPLGDCSSSSSTPRQTYNRYEKTTNIGSRVEAEKMNSRMCQEAAPWQGKKPLSYPPRRQTPTVFNRPGLMSSPTSTLSAPTPPKHGKLTRPGLSMTPRTRSGPGEPSQASSLSRPIPPGSCSQSSPASSRLHTSGGPFPGPQNRLRPRYNPTAAMWSGPSSQTTISGQGIVGGPSGKPGARAPVASSPSEESDVMTAGDVVMARQGAGLLSDGDSDTQVFLCVVWQAGKLGAAVYDSDTTEISMMPDAVETDDFLLLKKLVLQTQPNKLVVSAKQDDRIMQLLQPTDNEGLISTECLQMMPSVYFALEHCKRRILMLDLPTIPADMGEAERTVYLSSLVPMENTNMVRALGGLLKFLDKYRVGVELEDESIRVPIIGLTTFTLKHMVMIDESTYSALQIFSREDHPSVYKTGVSHASKEGFSLFGVMNRCRSQVGSRLLRLWFLRPTSNMDTLRERQQAVAFFLHPGNAEITNTLHDCVKHVKNITRILARMRQSQASLGDWQALYKTAYNAIYIADTCKAYQEKLVIASKIVAAFSEDLHRIANLISRIVDFDESLVQNRFVVKPGVDPDLDEKKRTYNGLPDVMTKVAREELSRLSEDISSCNVIYLPQLGYLLAIPQTDDLTEENGYHIPDLEFKFLCNRMVHYKSASTKVLDRQLGDTQCDITDRETVIMHRLQNSILEHSQVLLRVMEVVAELDCLLCLACCARESNYVCPEMSTSSVLKINGGRHPLQELCCSPFVPNDTQSGGGASRIKVLTGPNACGKSVYLKQVGVIVFLAHVGSFVPVETATIGLVDSIYSRIQTRESVSVGLSTFMIDLNQVSLALRCATEKSLVLLDEFGKGTQTADGVSILVACLKFWLNQGTRCPHIFTTTHFHSLVTKQLLPASPFVAYQTMEVLHDNEELVFLYQLIDGSTDMSYACHVASLVGLPTEIVKRGREVTDLIRRHQPIQRIGPSSIRSQPRNDGQIVIADTPMLASDGRVHENTSDTRAPDTTSDTAVDAGSKKRHRKL